MAASIAPFVARGARVKCRIAVRGRIEDLSWINVLRVVEIGIN